MYVISGYFMGNYEEYITEHIVVLGETKPHAHALKNMGGRYSRQLKGGKIGWVNENKLSPMIYDVIKNYDVGEFTKPINIPGGLLILKILYKSTKFLSYIKSRLSDSTIKLS